jgi:hypothetical protein
VGKVEEEASVAPMEGRQRAPWGRAGER